MKTREIVVGKAYTDGKGAVRLVVAAGPKYVLYSEQGDKDCVRYRLLEKKRGPHYVGYEMNTTRNSFARWATEEIDLDDQGRPVHPR